MIYFYVQFAKSFYWIPSQVDEQEIDVVFDFLRIAHLTKEGKTDGETVCIDQVLF